MERADVLIVGGGPGGSTCARELSRRGVDALVLDRATFPRDKPCAGWITPAVVEELDLDLADYARGRVLQPFHGFAVELLGTSRMVAVDYGRPVSYGIRRPELDHYLLERSGARRRLDCAARTFERRGDRWIVNGELEARVLVGAGGHFCPVARTIGEERATGELAVVAQEVEVLEPAGARCAIPPELPHLYFCADLRGYGWCERKGGWVNVGLGRQDAAGLPRHVSELVASLRARGVVSEVTAPFKGHAYLLYEAPPRRRVVGDGALLVGDAAGLAHPRSGEGIRTAVESGLLAARAIVDALPDLAQRRLERYRARIAERFGGPERVSWSRAGELLPDRWTRRLAARLFASPWFTRRVVLDRWFYGSDRPPLAA